jgi:BirA family transcriptional regulator, biotin operon repressor / biotin---[acetyl-CoA-carboxylase] ligase
MPQTASTSDEAARWAEAGAPEGAWVVADEQTAGRGRRGRAWHSPAGAGLYLSVVFRPSAGAVPAGSSAPETDTGVSNDPVIPLLTLMAGVAVAEGIRRATGVPVTLKWPNDVIVEGSWRKVAGILAEATASGNAVQFVIVGIGVNLNRASYPVDVAARAVSLEELNGGPVDRDVVLVEILGALADWRADLVRAGADNLLRAWRQLAPSSCGCRVRWETREGQRSGTTAGIDGDGALLVESSAGVERIVAGEVQWQ